jgi:hypothetical protein
LFGESLAQANLLIPAADICSLSILSPTERSVKIRAFEPSTGFSLTDPNTDVITWDALKLDASNKEDINVFTTLAGGGPSVMELKTGTGQQYARIDGPICCAPTQIPTEIRFNPRAFGSSSATTGGITITYDYCTGEANAPFGYTELQNGAFICEGDELGYRSNTCNRIKKLGPSSGSALLTITADGLSGPSFYGFGNRIYTGPPINGEIDETCEPTGIALEEVVYDNRILAKFDSCGIPEAYSYPEGVLLNQVFLWIGVAGENGRIDSRQVYRIVAGPRNGSIIYANPSYYCTVFGIGCYR